MAKNNKMFISLHASHFSTLIRLEIFSGIKAIAFKMTSYIARALPQRRWLQPCPE